MRELPIVDRELFYERFNEVFNQIDNYKVLADIMGVSGSAVYNYKNGKTSGRKETNRLPPVEALFRLAQYIGKPIEWFLYDKNRVKYDIKQWSASAVLNAIPRGDSI